MPTGNAGPAPVQPDNVVGGDVAAFVNTLPHLVWIVAPNGEIRWGNRRWDAFTGRTTGQPPTLDWQSLVHPAARADVAKRWAAALRGEKGFELELLLRNADGSYCPFITRGAPRVGAAGAITDWIVTLSNVSTQSDAKDALRLSEASYRGTFENAAVGICHVAPDGSFLRVNQTLCEITGYPREELLTLRFPEITHPEDLEHDLQQAQRLAAGEISTYSMEKRYVRKDGSVLWVNLTGSAVRDESGRLRHFIAVIESINARKLAEAKLRQSESTLRLALGAAYLVAFVWDIEKNEVRRHQNAEDLMTSTDEKPDTLQAVREYVHPEDRATFDANIAAALHHPAGTYASEFRLIGRNGEVRWLLESGRVEFTRDGQPLRLIGLSQDITERKAAEIKLREAQRELQAHAERLEAAVADRTARLQEVVTELDSFSHSIAHDLRAPLRSIRNFADIIVEEHSGELSETVRSCLARIVRASGKMDTMIHEVLEYSRMSRAELELEAIDPAEILTGLIESYPHFQPPQANITIDGVLPPILASHSALTQCFVNLLGNAVKFVAPGVSPQVRIWAEPQAERVRLWIEDNGIGIPPDSLEKIWGMLERLHSGYEGAGVGLCIVRKAVERMGGTVGVESEVGQGSRFWIELPRAA